MQTRQHSGRASKGSQFHLQNLVNDCPEYLNCLILSSSPSLQTYAATHPKWASPLVPDNYIEYQDEQFLEAIGFRNSQANSVPFGHRVVPFGTHLRQSKGKTVARASFSLKPRAIFEKSVGKGAKQVLKVVRRLTVV